MIVPHGDSDPVFSLNDTLDWYREVDAGAHGAAASFVRVFPVPGAGSPDRHGRPGFALARPRTADLRLSRHRALQGTGRPGGRFQLRMQAVKSSLMR
jgi:feruloyl esterase